MKYCIGYRYKKWYSIEINFLSGISNNVIDFQILHFPILLFNSSLARFVGIESRFLAVSEVYYIFDPIGVSEN